MMTIRTMGMTTIASRTVELRVSRSIAALPPTRVPGKRWTASRRRWTVVSDAGVAGRQDLGHARDTQRRLADGGRLRGRDHNQCWVRGAGRIMAAEQFLPDSEVGGRAEVLRLAEPEPCLADADGEQRQRDHRAGPHMPRPSPDPASDPAPVTGAGLRPCARAGREGPEDPAPGQDQDAG